MVLNNPPRGPGDSSGGPCYRCVFPKPPPADSVTSCSEGGILGPVVGTMGVLQALEAIKLIAAGLDLSSHWPIDADTPMSGASSDTYSDAFLPTSDQAARVPPSASLLLFSAYSTPQFRSIRLRSRRITCQSCSATASITPSSLTSGSLDYIAFCGVTTPVNILPAESRISARHLASTLQDFPSNLDTLSPAARAAAEKEGTGVTILDVRDAIQFELCNLPGSINVPWTANASTSFATAIREREHEVFGGQKDVVVMCKLGNDSQMAVQVLKELRTELDIRDVKGGFRAWREEVDGSWPDY